MGKFDDHIHNIVDLIRIKSVNDEDVKYHYKKIIELEDLTHNQLIYLEDLIFGEIPYSKTKKKMEKLMRKSISEVSFQGKEISNIERFIREYKLNKIK